MELRNAILEELQNNPALEELPMENISIDAERSSGEDSSSNDDSSDNAELEFGEDFKILNQLDEDWREFYAQENSGSSYTSEDAERRDHFFNSLTADTSLQEHLLRQAEMSDYPPEVISAFEYLVGSLDDRGFLNGTVSDLALMGQFPYGDMQQAMVLMKSLDPVGIGSTDIRECLLTQLRHYGHSGTLAETIVDKHFELLLRRRIPDLARKTSSSMTDVEEALEIIGEMDPAPGRKFSDDNNHVIEPDVKVEKDDMGEWQIILNSDYIPRLRISNIYKDLIAKAKLSGKEREYIQEKMRSGKFLISSIEQRQQTIERITREILKFQHDFFEEGLKKLRPLTMVQVAEKVGVHETTVSRAIANKYIDTPWGIFEFKYFFTPGYKSGTDGESVSNTTIKERIARLIDMEDPVKPRSDQEIVRMLEKEDVKIARRTVAKYREELGIPPTNLRRQWS